jgi:uncharacterized membrane protein (UPF0127 family)
MVDMRWLLVGAFLLGSTACTDSPHLRDRPASEVTFEGSDAVLYVDVADDAEERLRGLMGVHHLPEDQGMAFVFERPVTTGFWMKDTLIPLSIAFVDEDDRVVGLKEMEPCAADPCPSYGVDEPYVMAIEANTGWFEDHGVREGERAELEVVAYG